jgi:hypothetical protein
MAKKYLVFQRPQKRAVIKEKVDRYGRELSREILHKRGMTLIEGPANAGKSKWLNRIDCEAALMWEGKKIIKLSARASMSEITEALGLPQKKLYHRINAIPAWAKENAGKFVLLIDDINTATGRKVDSLKTLITNAYAAIMTAININQMPTALRYVVINKAHVIRLSSKASYDATPILLMLVALISVAAGAWEIAAVLGGLGMLSRGRGATKSS